MSAYSGPKSAPSGLVFAVDAGSTGSYSQNVIPYPLDLYSWSGSAGINTGTQIRDTTVTDSPVGGIPLKLTSTGTDCYIGTYAALSWNLASAASGQTWTVSFYAKAPVATTSLCYLFGANSSGTYVELTSNTNNITTSWQRFSFSLTFSNASTVAVQFRFGCNVNGGIIWFDGLQIERASSATTFNPRPNTTGYTWRDISGNNLTTTLTNYPTYSTSNGGNFTFNGSNSSAVVGNSSILKNNDTSIECFLKNNGTLSGDIIQFGVGSGSYAQYYFRSFSGNTYWDWFPVTASSYGEVSVSNSTYFPAGTWKHVVITGANTGAVTMYINGVSVGSPTLTATSAVAAWTPANLTIGGFTWDGYTTASFAYVRIYNRVLTASEAAQLFTAQRGRFGV